MNDGFLAFVRMCARSISAPAGTHTKGEYRGTCGRRGERGGVEDEGRRRGEKRGESEWKETGRERPTLNYSKIRKSVANLLSLSERSRRCYFCQNYVMVAIFFGSSPSPRLSV